MRGLGVFKTLGKSCIRTYALYMSTFIVKFRVSVVFVRRCEFRTMLVRCAVQCLCVVDSFLKCGNRRVLLWLSSSVLQWLLICFSGSMRCVDVALGGAY